MIYMTPVKADVTAEQWASVQETAETARTSTHASPLCVIKYCELANGHPSCFDGVQKYTRGDLDLSGPEWQGGDL